MQSNAHMECEKKLKEVPFTRMDEGFFRPSLELDAERNEIKTWTHSDTSPCQINQSRVCKARVCKTSPGVNCQPYSRAKRHSQCFSNCMNTNLDEKEKK